METATATPLPEMATGTPRLVMETAMSEMETAMAMGVLRARKAARAWGMPAIQA
jgi:hypothetical protein